MVWGLAVNLSEIPAFSTVYWVLHGVLLFSAFAVLIMLGRSLLVESIRSLLHLRLGIESLFMLSLLGALGGSMYATITGSGSIYYEVIIVVLVIFSFGRKIGQVSKDRAMAEANRYRQQFNEVVRLSSTGEREIIAYCQLADGDTFEITPGMPVCANGSILSGSGYVKETALTGEPHPVVKNSGDTVLAGTWSVDGTFTCEAQISNAPRLIDAILSRVESSIATTKSFRQIQAERWIQYFVVAVCIIALLTGIFWGKTSGLSTGWLNSMSVLLVACPCALGLATPLAVWTGLWQLSAMGLVSRSSHLMDALAHTKHLFFDKTGTLTESSLSIGEINVAPDCPWTSSQVFAMAFQMETHIQHPIARAFQKHLEIPENALPDSFSFVSQQWIPGKGIKAKAMWQGSAIELKLGTHDWVAGMQGGTTRSPKHVVMGMGSIPVAEITLIEDLRPGVTSLIKRLQTMGIRSTVLTGDPFPQWSQIAGATIRENLSPDQKAAMVQHSSASGENPVFIGDGINDLNAMVAAHASIAIEDGGAALTQSNASAILTGNQLESIASAIRLAKRIDQTLTTNLRIALVYNMIGISLAAAGKLHPVASVLIMIVSSLLVTFRAIRKAEAIADPV